MGRLLHRPLYKTQGKAVVFTRSSNVHPLRCHQIARCHDVLFAWSLANISGPAIHSTEDLFTNKLFLEDSLTNGVAVHQFWACLLLLLPASQTVRGHDVVVLAWWIIWNYTCYWWNVKNSVNQYSHFIYHATYIYDVSKQTDPWTNKADHQSLLWINQHYNINNHW